MVFINSLAFANSCISLTIAREFLKGRLSVQLPVSFSFAEPTISNSMTYTYYDYIYDYRITQKSIDAGLGVYFHTGKRAVTHFIGPLFRFAQYNGYFKANDYYQDPNYGYLNYNQNPRKHGFVMNETYFMINNGFLFRITPRFNLMVNAAVGFIANRTYVANDPNNFIPTGYYGYTNNIYQIYNNPVAQIGVHAGFRF